MCLITTTTTTTTTTIIIIIIKIKNIIIIIIIIIIIVIIVIIIVIIIIIIIIIIIAFKGAIRDFFKSHCFANRLQHVFSIGSGATACKSRATHPALITCNMSVPHGRKGQLLSY